VSKLGISIATLSGIPYADYVRLACEAEDAGFAAVMSPESNNDVLMCLHGVAKATSRIKLASFIANIYYREPVLCAAAAEMLQTESDGRFILGLGSGPPQTLTGLGIERGNARDRLRRYVDVIRRAHRGEPLAATGIRVRAPATPVPIHFGALVKETARLAGEIADGVMLYIAPPERMRTMIDTARAEAHRHGRKASDFSITTAFPVFLADDRKSALEAARRGLFFYVALPFYNRVIAKAGFETEASAIASATSRGEFAGAVAAMSDRLVDWLAAVGPAEHCRERLAQYRALNPDLAVIAPNPVGEDYPAAVRRAIKVFSQAK
jgi:alkanesulfonate monooxygenase SsuD/methylene tetrahydromethanopterin reductase-like flavin-dependent oxidoreductase (luciferase family)